MKKVIVTPAGRKRYLEILLNYLKCYLDEFDRWDLWLNTENEEDINYIKSIAEENNFIQIVYCDVPIEGINSVNSFYKKAINENEIYLKLDDDIVFIEKGSIRKIFEERIENDSSLLIFGNIINNSIITHLHQRTGNFSYNFGKAGYYCGDNNSYWDPVFAEKLHREFLENKDSKNFYLQNWIFLDFERVSINVCSWKGSDFKDFNGILEGNDEYLLTEIKPKEVNRPNLMIGETLFVHFSFYSQRDHLDNTDLLEKYKTLSEKVINKI